MEHERAQKKHFDAIAEQYTRRIDEKGYKYYFEFTRDNIVGALNENLENLAECRGLDVGCGQGDLAAAIQKSCREVYGTDLSEGMVSVAAQLHNRSELKFIASPSDRMPFEDSYFDFSVSTHLFHHLASEDLIEKTILEMARVTRSGGVIVIVDVNRCNPASHLIQYLMVKRGVDTGDEVLVFPKTIIKFFEKHRITLVKYKPFCFVPHFLPWLKNCDTVLANLPFSKFRAKDYVIVGRVEK